ncbi:hypothetical protein D3C78_964960 [compost metagenome]
MMPPSPRLSIRMANMAYFSEVTITSVQKISDSRPRITGGDGASPERNSTVFRVYSGLVPISPNTTPNAPPASSGRLILGVSGSFSVVIKRS